MQLFDTLYSIIEGDRSQFLLNEAEKNRQSLFEQYNLFIEEDYIVQTLSVFTDGIGLVKLMYYPITGEAELIREQQESGALVVQYWDDFKGFLKNNNL